MNRSPEIMEEANIPTIHAETLPRAHRQWTSRTIFFLLVCGMCIGIPALLLKGETALVRICLEFTLNTLIFCALTQIVRKGPLAYLLALTGASYYLSLYWVILYRFFAGDSFDAFFFLDGEVVSTSTQIFGWGGSVGIIAFLGCLFIVFFGIWKFSPEIVYAKKYPAIFLGIFFVLKAWSFDHDLVWKSVDSAFAESSARDTISGFQPTDAYETSSDENIFFLQLESLNAMAAHGDFGSRSGEATYIPKIRQIARDGIFFPYFWGNAHMTNRAQESILCGIVMNIDVPFSLRLHDIRTKCLPQMLAESGYTTIVFRSDKLEFANEGNFFTKIGFQEVHHSDIMEPDDERHEWGYDDCIFYKRSFEYLKKHYPSPRKLFVYVEVSSHHIPFARREQYKDIEPFASPKNFTERFTNSLVVQDHCAGEFYDEYKRYTSENSHLFVFGDHSYPAGTTDHLPEHVRSSHPEQRLTIFTYVPPIHRASSFLVGSTVQQLRGQTDFIPTLFELLNGKKYANSFAFELLQNSAKGDYEDCHVLVEGAKSITVVRNQNEYVKYWVPNGNIYSADLTNGLFLETMTEVASNVAFEKFKRAYLCGRYKQ